MNMLFSTRARLAPRPGAAADVDADRVADGRDGVGVGAGGGVARRAARRRVGDVLLVVVDGRVVVVVGEVVLVGVGVDVGVVDGHVGGVVERKAHRVGVAEAVEAVRGPGLGGVAAGAWDALGGALGGVVVADARLALGGALGIVVRARQALRGRDFVGRR
jgi:hypothetical protein